MMRADARQNVTVPGSDGTYKILVSGESCTNAIHFTEVSEFLAQAGAKKSAQDSERSAGGVSTGLIMQAVVKFPRHRGRLPIEPEENPSLIYLGRRRAVRRTNSFNILSKYSSITG